MKNFSCLFVLCFLLAGCGGASPEPVASTPTPQPIVEATPTQTVAYLSTDPIPADGASPPVLIEISSIGLYHPVAPMEWEVAEVDGTRTTVWVLPENAAGWHVDSAKSGTAGNMLLSGHQEEGAAVFKPISLGSIAVGETIQITDEAGRIVAYTVDEISEPIPLDAPTSDQVAQVEKYYRQSTEPRLTLITGWPDFATTHRIFLIGQFAGVLAE